MLTNAARLSTVPAGARLAPMDRRIRVSHLAPRYSPTNAGAVNEALLFAQSNLAAVSFASGVHRSAPGVRSGLGNYSTDHERRPIMITFDETVTGTLDQLEPELRARGYVAVRTMAGPIDLAVFDPYGMRKVGSVNIKSERWAHHIYRGTLADVNGRPYLADAKRPEPPFVGGLFELLTTLEL
jgi:hypothetical protein